MARKRHYIAANASTEIPSNLLFVDCESYINQIDSDHSELSLRLWAAQTVKLEGTVTTSNRFYDDRTAFAFWELVDQQVQKKKPLWILAHNARFDMRQLQLWNQFDNGRFKYVSRLKDKRFSIMAVDSRPWFIRCQHESGATVWIVDTMNYWKMTLEELGNLIGLQKLECDLIDDDDKKILRYCERDVAIIKKAFVELVCDWQTRELGNWRTSAAGLSMQNFRHWHCDDREPQIDGRKRYNILSDPDSVDLPFERDGYLGGRIEAFYYGQHSGPVYHLDVRSMYPSVMLTGFYPIERLYSFDQMQVGDVANLIPAYGVMAECRINSRVDTYPVRYKKRQHHANGQFWTILCGRELERAIQSGECQQINHGIVYRIAPIFAEWVSYWHALRTESNRIGNQSLAVLSKLILNSLHGKFGQRGIKWQDSEIEAPYAKHGEKLRWGMFTHHNFDTGEIRKCRVLDGSVMIEEEGPPPPHAFPAISAMISADVRERLRDLINLCPPESVLYTAVDSLIVTKPGYDALLLAGEIRNKEIGKLQLLGEYDDCEIRSHGCYRLGEHWTAAGLWGKCEMDFRGAWTANAWNYNDIFNFDDDGTVYINRVSVNAPRANPKGEMLLNGFVRPFTINPSAEFLMLPTAEQRRIMFEELI